MEKSATCIIVEDDPGFQRILEKQLERLGNIEILGVYGDSVNAAVQIERLKPDLLFLDIMISGLEGPDFLDMLTHQPAVIIISAHDEDVMNEYDVEYSAYLRKPVSISELEQAINKALY